MPSFKWARLLLLVSAHGYAFDMERDTWLLPAPPVVARHTYQPLDFAQIHATGNERDPVYADAAQRALIAAAEKNDLQQVAALLKQNVNPNARLDQWGDNALVHAVRHGNIDMTRVLLDAGADPDQMGKGFRPLGIAALRGDMRIARLLLDAGAHVDFKSNDGNTPIVAATLMHRTAVVKVLLAYKPDMTIWNREGRTALGIAVQDGELAIVKLLLDADTDPNLLERNGNRPLYWADGQHAIALLLVKRGGY
jgi:ankyrin repeat protein